LQDQLWCDLLRPNDRGLMLPEMICTAYGWTPTPLGKRAATVSPRDLGCGGKRRSRRAPPTAGLPLAPLARRGRSNQRASYRAIG